MRQLIVKPSTGGGGGSYTDEQAQDAVGGILVDSASLDFTYSDGTPSITADVDMTAFTTSDLAEGTNLYYTDERVDDRVGALLVEGTGIDLTYNDVGDSLTIASTITQYTDELAQDAVAALIQNGTGITWSYNDGANTLTPTVTITQYTDELAQDAIGAMIDTSLVYVDGTPLLTRAALTGDVTASQGSNALTIANDAVTFAKFQNITTARVLGRTSASTGDVEELSAGTGIAISSGSISSTITQYTDEQAQDTVATLIQNGTGISWTYSDAGNTLTPAVTLSPFTTSNLTEGSNLYFTNERVDDRVAALLVQGTNVTLTYDDTLNTLTVDAATGASTGLAYVTIGNTSSLSAERALTGTTNQVIITDNGANSTAVLSTPQDIHTAATPQFAGLTLGASSGGSLLNVKGSASFGNTYYATAAPTDGLLIEGSVLIGATSAIQTDALEVRRTFTGTSGTVYGQFVGVSANPASASTQLTIGLGFIAQSAGAQNQNTVDGISGQVLHSGSGTLGQAAGVFGITENGSSGTITAAYGASGSLKITGSGNIGTGIGYQVSPPQLTSTGRITGTSIGHFVLDQSSTDTSLNIAVAILNQAAPGAYALYSEGGKYLFNGNQTADSDFTIMGDTDAGLFFVDTSNDSVQIASTGTSKVGFYGATPVVRSSTYTPSNVTTDRAYDANATTLDEVADVLGTLIADLKAVGIIG